ncbi:MAG TPA: ComF family protein [Nitrospiraceae bacterium]|nr:ComF family protein [Nitrospiraceae bacterium]
MLDLGLRRAMTLLNGILSFILPTSCCHCNSPVGDSFIPFFCSSCWDDFPLLDGPTCPRCGRLFESPEALAHSPSHLCGTCRQRLPHYDQALSVGYFEGPLRDAIHQFKYRPCRTLAGPLSDWMLRDLRLTPGIDFIMPVPLHRARLRKRGFNQSLLLAHAVSEFSGIPLSYDNLLRIRPTRPQIELTEEERIQNVAGAFSLTMPEAVKGKTLLLVDDVFTTGATMNACAAVLKESGAERIVSLTLARPG